MKHCFFPLLHQICIKYELLHRQPAKKRTQEYKLSTYHGTSPKQVRLYTLTVMKIKDLNLSCQTIRYCHLEEICLFF
jgi:hypothetical protein